jgi:dolichol-phosphate mannosyltransferase
MIEIGETRSAHTTSTTPPGALDALARREEVSDRYWSHNDPINQLRVWWRAQTARHLLHLLPGETILELGCGSGQLTQALVKTTRQECPLTAATFGFIKDEWRVRVPSGVVERVTLSDFPGPLAGRQFDYVLGTNLLDAKHAPWLLQQVQHLLKPGGHLLFFETNPWNPIFGLRRRVAAWVPLLRRGDERTLPNQVRLYELLSELGYVRITATPYDFLYPPIPKRLMLVARNLTLVLENTPGIRRLAGAILLHAQKLPREVPRRAIRMVEHSNLHDAISVVVPCHNEEANVSRLVKGLFDHYDDYIHEIIMVDDNSKDGTRKLLEQLALSEPRVHPVIRRPPNGVGRALRDGLQHATGKYVLTMDCDFLQILPELRDLFDAAAEGHDVVLGSRFSRESVLINYPLQKILCNRAFHVLASVLFHRKIRDFTNNLKVLSRDVVMNLDLEAPWFAANAETGLKPILMGFRAKEVPVSWINRTPDQGESSFSLLRNGVGYGKVLAALVARTRVGFKLLERRGPTRLRDI